MRPADQIEQLLTELQDHASAAFDQWTLRDMFSALETSTGGSPAHSWQDIGRAVIHSRVTKLAAAAILALALLLLVRHLIGHETAATPGGKNDTVARAPHNPEVPAPTTTAREQEQARLARELAAARELFAKTDVKGLLRLLDTGLDETKIAVAGYLAEIGDESALPALQKLADQWQDPAQDNPFRESIEKIRNVAPGQDDTAPESLPTQEPAQPADTATVPAGPHIVVRVMDKGTAEPIPQATIRVSLGGESQTHATDDQGVSVLDLGASIPDYLRINVSQEEYVWQDVTLRDRGGEKLPETVQFALEKGIVIGGVVQDSDGHPIEGASVESYSISEQRQYHQPCVIVRIEQMTDAHGRWRSGANVPREIDRLWFNVRHPDFADDGFEMPDDLKLDDLRAERAVMVLDEGLAVSGRVTDMAGGPIVGAKLLAGEDYFARDWTQTDDAGRFEFRHLRPLNRSFLLTAQVPGFAPQRKELPSEKGLAPVEFVLEPARLLIGRVVDGAGKPVEDAYVGSEDWNGFRTVKWQGRTDSSGMFIWDYPPLDAIEIRISKSGYREVEQEVVATDREQTFVLVKPTTIRGAVTDSETGQMVSRFKVTPGAHWRSGNKATWQESWVKWFTDGRYSYTFSGDGLAYAVRIEADGYVPFESPFVDANELEVTIDVALTKGRGPSGYVFDANAVPVQGVEVFWEKNVYIRDGQMLNRTHRVYVKTDRDGRFTFKPQDRKDPLLAICDQGMGIALYEDFARDGIITLTPWARVQGELRVGTRPAVKKQLQLTGLSRLPGDIQPPVNETTTDEHGWFVFERVYPGEFRLYNQTYEVLPGQTLELHLGGTGRTVRGELALPVPSDVPIWADLYLTTMSVPIPFDKYPKPPGYEQMSPGEVEAWLQRFGRTAEGKAYPMWLQETYPETTRSLRVEIDERSTFHVDNVEPGVYALKGTIRHSPTHDSSRLNEIIGRLWHQVVVPPFTSDADLDTPLDLGTLAVLPGDLKAGDAAPDFDVPTFGPGRIRLTDYRGKVLLVSFSAWGYTAPGSTATRDLKDIYQRFCENPQYAQVSLLFAGNPLVDKRAIDEAQLPWPHGLVPGPESREATEYDIHARPYMPWNILISSRGDILGVGLSGASLQQAIEEALAAAR